ncbi:hypothetical protein K488DRAFT_73713 [Vararia minispora EC-137]|uniref:Uncharacterized protein n=1 Tax=Vararia minispora EC-137 TaxID=1314806 RepID=A0ACB8Q9M5_9AGAM|nr:hypothetical protein K488DRAFT_73713 [Vararia minispora EC-137]
MHNWPSTPRQPAPGGLPLTPPPSAGWPPPAGPPPTPGAPYMSTVPLPATPATAPGFPPLPTPPTSPSYPGPPTAGRTPHPTLCPGAIDWDIRLPPARARVPPAVLRDSALACPVPIIHIHIPSYGARAVTGAAHGAAVCVRDVLDALDAAFRQPVPPQIVVAVPQAVMAEAQAALARRGGSHYALADLQGPRVFFRGLAPQPDGSFLVLLDHRPLR